MIFAPKSLSGHPVTGDRFVRFAYLDESQDSNSGANSDFVVAGVLVNADKSWKRAEGRLSELADEYVRPDHRDRFYFHAKDIFHGHGEFDRDRWPLKERLELLGKLAAIPRQFNLPIVHGVGLRGVDVVPSGARVRNPDFSRYILSYTEALIWADLWARSRFRSEVISVVVEDIPNIRRHVKGVHRAYKDRIEPSNLLPFRRIIDTVHFAEKNDCSLLQLADLCAFVIRNRLVGRKDIMPIYEELLPQIVIPPPIDQSRIPMRSKMRMARIQFVKQSKRVNP